ncbi:T-cell immunoglobulin and mucin domain-containing protein 4 [Lonchura striata]|nr:T-cell immunoglobulin and mucin domain-containing protein 4 [Lonchura striata domestica]
MLSSICLNWVLLVLLTGSTVSELIVIGEVGQNITVPCHYTVWNTNSITSMCWGRDRCPNSKCSQPIIWTDGWRVTEQHSSRYQLRGDLQKGDVSLTIVDAREADSGTYCCRVEIPGLFNDQLINHKVTVKKARISTASPHTYTSEQTSEQFSVQVMCLSCLCSAPGSTSESSVTVTRTWPLVSASEAPQTVSISLAVAHLDRASAPCSGPSGCLDVAANLQNSSVSLASQQDPERGLYIGIGSCAALLLILILALLLTKQPPPESDRIPLLSSLTAHTASEAVVRGTIGQPVTLPCSYRVTRPKDISDMCWGRGPCPNSKCRGKILHTSGSRVMSRASWRYSLRGSVAAGDVSLTISVAEAEDAGVYCCRVEIPGLFNDIKRNIRLEVATAPLVSTTATTTTTEAPVFSKHFIETTSAPQATSDFQAAPETTVLLTTSSLPAATTAPESPVVATGETSAPSTIAGTEYDIFPVTMVETTPLPDFPTASQAADVATEDDMFCSTLSGITEGGLGKHKSDVVDDAKLESTAKAVEVTTEFPGTLPSAEETSSSVLMEERTVMEVSANRDGNAGKYEERGDKFPSSAILIACVVAGSILFILMLLVWKRKHTKKFIVKSVGPPEETDKVFSGAEGENNIFSL